MQAKGAVPSTGVFIIDELVAKPGQGQAVFEAFMSRYVPGAEARGMVLLHRLVEPAFWLVNGSNRLVFIWTLKDAGAVWQKNFAARDDTAVLAFWWKEIEPMLESRKRATLCEPSEIARYCDV